MSLATTSLPVPDSSHKNTGAWLRANFWMVFLTGSDTSANALFAALQATTAQQIGVPEVLLVAANTSGGVTGKMIWIYS